MPATAPPAPAAHGGAYSERLTDPDDPRTPRSLAGDPTVAAQK